ncbi:MAG: hypothetical protein ACM31L_02955 [Actinomycetota bacterium]
MDAVSSVSTATVLSTTGVAKTTAPTATSSTTSSTAASTATTTKTLSSSQGADAVGKALTSSQSNTDELAKLQDDIRQATSSGQPLDTATVKALNDKIAAVAAKIDANNAAAKSGTTNLLQSGTGAVSVNTKDGVTLTISAQTQDSKSLGLSDLKITDEASLRKATAAISQAAAQSQLTTFRLQAAESVTGGGSSGATVSATTSVSKALAKQMVSNLTGNSAITTTATQQASLDRNAKAVASVQQALTAQRSANKTLTTYGSSGQDTSTAKSLFSILA